MKLSSRQETKLITKRVNWPYPCRLEPPTNPNFQPRPPPTAVALSDHINLEKTTRPKPRKKVKGTRRQASSVWSSYAYRKGIKIKIKNKILKSAAAKQIFASWTRKEPGSKCSTGLVYCNPSARGCSSIHTLTVVVTLVITGLQIKLPKEDEGLIIFPEQETGWPIYQLNSRGRFLVSCHSTNIKPFTSNRVKKTRNWTCLWDKDSNSWKHWHIVWGVVIQDVGHTCEGPWRSASTT